MWFVDFVTLGDAFLHVRSPCNAVVHEKGPHELADRGHVGGELFADLSQAQNVSCAIIGGGVRVGRRCSGRGGGGGVGGTGILFF